MSLSDIAYFSIFMANKFDFIWFDKDLQVGVTSAEATVTVQEAAAGRISVSVVGFSMGNAWISPDEQAMSYGPMLYQLVNNTLCIRYKILICNTHRTE